MLYAYTQYKHKFRMKIQGEIMTKSQKEFVVKSYAKYFGRAADADTIKYYGEKDNGKAEKASKVLNNIITDAGVYKGDIPDKQVVNEAFQNLFGRDAYTTEMNKYIKFVEKGKDLPINSIVKSAAKTDKAVYNNKMAVAVRYAELGGKGDLDLSKISKGNLIDLNFLKTVTKADDLKAKVYDLPEISGVPSAFDGKTYTLTTDIDSGKKFVGTSKNDLFIADDTGTLVTSPADSLDGGKGEDTFLVYGTPNAIPTLKNIENVIVDNMTAAGAADFSTQTGIKSATVKNAVGVSTIKVADGVSVTLEKNADDATAQTVNYSATQTTANLTLNKVITKTAVKVDVNGAAVTTLNISTTGAASTVGLLDVDTNMATLNITGDKNLTIIDAVSDTVNTIDASTFTGNLSVKVADASEVAPVSGVDVADITVNTGSGADTVDLTLQTATNEVAVNTGAGNDTVKVLNAATYTAASATTAGDIIDGGEGTDTLSVNGNLAASDMSASIKNFEVLEFTADAAGTNMSVNKTGINSFVMGDAIDVTLTGLSNNSTVTMSGAGTAGDGSKLDATIGTDGTADVLNVNLESTGATTGSEVTAVNYDTLNIVSTKAAADAATVTNTLADITATSAAALNISGTQALTITTAGLKADAAVDASALTGKLNATFASALKSFKGSSTAENKLSLAVAGNLKQGATFTAGSATTDTITVAAAAAQDMGILALTGFETLNLTTSGANAMDLRNVTGLNTIAVDATAGTDTLVISRMNSETVLKFGATNDITSVTTTVASGTTQSVTMASASGNDVILLNLDSGTTKLKLAFDDGDATASEAIGTIGTITGTSLATIEVSGKDDANLGINIATTVTTIDASALTGELTVTASATGTTITGGAGADAITGGTGDDVIRGGKGADTIIAGTGSNTIIFEANGADNGLDIITLTTADKLNFKNFISSLSVDKNGGTGTAITAYDASSVSDVNITNKIALYSDASYNGAAAAATIAALIQGTGDAFSLTAGGKAILITGDAAGANDGNQLWYIDDSLDGVSGNISAADVVSVGVTGAAFDLDTLNTNNFVIA